jgi:DUF1009 family protein
MEAQSTTLGLIAGGGRLPRDIAAAAQARGFRVIAVALRGCCDPSLRESVDELHWLDVGQLDSLFRIFRGGAVSDAVMAGKVWKEQLFRRPSAGSEAGLKLDDSAAGVLASLASRSDDAIQGAIADALAAEGVVLRPQAELVPELLPGEGPLGKCVPTPEQQRDIEFGFDVAKALGRPDVGQSVVVKGLAVMAVEAIEGTDAAIQRGAELGGPGVCVVKVAKPAQDPRFDLPAVGPGTLEVMRRNSVAALAFEAGATLVLDRTRLVGDADAAGIAILGVSAQSPGGPLVGAGAR